VRIFVSVVLSAALVACSGLSDLSAPSVSAPSEGVPTSLSATATQYGVSLVWTVPKIDTKGKPLRSAVTGYRLAYGLKGQPKTHKVIYAASKTSTSLRLPKGSYAFVVYARVGTFEGPASNELFRKVP